MRGYRLSPYRDALAPHGARCNAGTTEARDLLRSVPIGPVPPSLAAQSCVRGFPQHGQLALAISWNG